MTAGDFDRFTVGVARLMLAFDKRLTEARIDMYFDRLKDVPIGIFEEAVPILIDQATSFPRISVVRRACDEAERRRQWRADKYQPKADQEGPFCDACNDTGWVRGRMWAAVYGAEVNCVRICECRKGNPVYRAKLGAANNALKAEGKYGGRLFD